MSVLTYRHRKRQNKCIGSTVPPRTVGVQSSRTVTVNMFSDLQKIRMCFILLPACLLFISLIYEWYNRINFQKMIQQDLLYHFKLIIDWWGLIRFLIRKSRFQFCHRRLHSSKLWVKSVRLSEINRVTRSPLSYRSAISLNGHLR